MIRTPLEPRQTFLDDPLRILRTIRFATRFNFTIVDEIDEAIALPEIKEALARKVTYDRIGRETDLMMSGENPEHSIEYFHKYKIFSHLLKFPETCAELQNEETVQTLTQNSLKVSQIFGRIFKSVKHSDNFLKIVWPEGDKFKELQRNLFYSVILLPFKDFEYTFKKGKKTKTEKVRFRLRRG